MRSISLEILNKDDLVFTPDSFMDGYTVTQTFLPVAMIQISVSILYLFLISTHMVKCDYQV